MTTMIVILKADIKRLKFYQLFRGKAWKSADTELGLLSDAFDKADAMDKDQRYLIYNKAQKLVSDMFKFETRVVDTIAFIMAMSTITILILIIREILHA